MNKRNSRNSHEKKYKGHTGEIGNFFINTFITIVSILIVCGVGFYLKNISDSNLQKNKVNNELSEEVKDTSEENIKQEEIKKRTG